MEPHAGIHSEQHGPYPQSIIWICQSCFKREFLDLSWMYIHALYRHKTEDVFEGLLNCFPQYMLF